jgi:NAD+ synthetase
MKVLIAQTNTTPRDFEGNVGQILTAVYEAKKNGAQLIVTPELSIPGYGVKDLMYQNHFVEKNLQWLGHICERTREVFRDCYLVVGYVDRNHSGAGKPFRNMVAVIHNGVVIATYAKQLLPFYDVFDEARYFEPGKELTVVEIDGVRWGLAICEDIWNDKGSDDYNYRTNPLARYREIGVDHIISVNSSPFVLGKPQKREEMLRKSFQKGTIIYVNQIGGQDDLVFDGHSLVIEDGMMVGSSKTTLEPTYEVTSVPRDVRSQPDVVHDEPNTVLARGLAKYVRNESDTELLFRMLVLGLRDYAHKSGFKKVVLGSSGGIDSALVACIACEALGPENVFGISMPSIYSSQGSKDDALQLHKNLGCWDYVVPIEHSDLVKRYRNTFAEQDHSLDSEPYNKVADENIQARIRGALVMYYSNAWGALPLTTGNKSESSVGYCTLYGDMCGGLSVISDLWKTQVYELARWYNKFKGSEVIPQAIIDKAPSAELAPGQKDEDALLPYPVLDPILKAYVEGYIGDFDEFLKSDALDNPSLVALEWLKNYEYAKSSYERMIRLVDVNEYKRRQAAPGIKVSSVAFGSGRRMPIVKK